jgi:metal-responsive CopG/Arc/MetJ family transcriptional regulator
LPRNIKITIKKDLADEVKTFLKEKPNLGYKDTSEFVEDAIYVWLRLNRKAEKRRIL